MRAAAAALLLGCFASAAAAEVRTAPPRRDFRATVDGIEFSVSVRTPEQLTAFYSGRRFPDDAVQRLARACFLTVGIRNTRAEVVWLDLAAWRFVGANRSTMRRLDRDYWNRVWQRMQLPAASRATFGWTLLPELRDLQPGEPVGGNVTLEFTPLAFSLEASFVTGAQRQGQTVRIDVPGLVCPSGTRLGDES